jgi:OOP family OmpA-OmpF porin
VIKIKKCLTLFSLSLIGLAFVACSSNVKRADIPSTANPQEEFTKLDTDINAAIWKNIDVLAPQDFRDARQWKDEAKSDLGSAEKQEEILNDIRKGRNALEKAYVTAEKREGNAPSIFEARHAALTAGAATHSELRNELAQADAAVSANVDSLPSLSTHKIVALQERYVKLERNATVATQLGNAQTQLNGARKDGATSTAPQTYKKAELSIKNAESAISSNVRSPAGFATAVTQANTDSTLLMDVTTVIKQNKNLSENSALKMVAQNRQIKDLKTDLKATNSAGAATEADLQDKNQQLSKASAQIEIQRAIEEARTQFTSDEAEAYQQGKTLVIRMKNVNFASGRSDLPGDSLASFAKVSKVAKSLNASGIKVEGHTDSVGTAAVNNTLSSERAQAVASYFKTNGFSDIEVESAGYGFSKPIATNKSKAGRAQNRRVDIIITPM